MDVKNFMELVIDVCERLNREGAEYVVGGGVAVNLHGYERGTKDMDLLVPRDLKTPSAYSGRCKTCP